QGAPRRGIWAFGNLLLKKRKSIVRQPRDPGTHRHFGGRRAAPLEKANAFVDCRRHRRLYAACAVCVLIYARAYIPALEENLCIKCSAKKPPCRITNEKAPILSL